MHISVDMGKAEMKRVDALLANIEPKKIDAAISRASIRAAGSGKTEIKKQVTAVYNILPKYVSDATTARRNATNNGAHVQVIGGPIALSKFTRTVPNSPKKTRVMQRQQIKKASSVTTMPNHFAAEMASGHVGIFERLRGTGGNRPRMKRPYRRAEKMTWGVDERKKGREPLEQAFGPSIPQMVGNVAVYDIVVESISVMMDKRLEHEFGRLMNIK